MFIAHRGKKSIMIKENTIESFKMAIEDNLYSGFELDIRESLDKEFMVIHDFFFNGNLVSKIDSKELEKYNIPRLSKVLELDTNKIILIEIKNKDIDIVRLNNLLNKYSNKNIYVMSFYNEVIKNLLSLEHTYKGGILNYIFNSEISYNEYDFICLLNNSITSNLIDYFKKRKIEVFSYGIIKKIDYQDDIYYIIDKM